MYSELKKIVFEANLDLVKHGFVIFTWGSVSEIDRDKEVFAIKPSTHADYFYGEIPCTRKLTEKEVQNQYEMETGKVIVETFRKLGIDPMAVPAALVACHGPFSWGANAGEAVHNAVVLEQVTKMAHHTLSVNKVDGIEQFLLDKHYLRKHGKDAYYGQK